MGTLFDGDIIKLAEDEIPQFQNLLLMQFLAFDESQRIYPFSCSVALVVKAIIKNHSFTRFWVG